MNCKFQNKSGLYLSYLDFSPNQFPYCIWNVRNPQFSCISSLYPLKFSCISSLNPLKFSCISSLNSVAYLGYSGFCSLLSVSQLDFKKSPIQVHIILNFKSIKKFKTNLGCIWVSIMFSLIRFPNWNLRNVQFRFMPSYQT